MNKNYIKEYSPKYVIELAQKFRLHPTPAEQRLWEVLQNKKPNGLRFRRQHPIGRYIADFYCHGKGLIVEVDEDIHLLPERMEYDKVRDEILVQMFTVLHLKNDAVLNNIEYCKRRIIDAAAIESVSSLAI
jgi:very-short-patch-repair endonuclease